MPSPAVSTRENALENLRTTLAAVTKGADYNFTIDDVARVDGPFYVYGDFWQSYKTVAFIEEGLSTWSQWTSDGVWLLTQEVFVQLVTKYEPDSINPFEQSAATKSTLRSRLIADVLKAVMVEHTRGGHAKQGTRLTDSAPVNLDGIAGETWVGEGWTAVEMRFELAMEVDEDAP